MAAPIMEEHKEDSLAPGSGRLGRVLLGAAIVLGLFQAGRLLWLINRFTVDVPRGDQWGFYRAFFTPHTPWQIFAWTHGMHRQGIGFFLTWLVNELTDWNQRAQCFTIGLVMLSAAAGALWLKRRLFGRLQWYDVIPVLLILRTKPPVARSIGSSPLPPPLPIPQATAGEPAMPGTVEAPSAGPAVQQSSRGYAAQQPLVNAANVFSWLLSIPAWLLLIGGLALALLAAIDLPGFIGAGLPEPNAAREITREFGFTRWPTLMRNWTWIVSHSTLFIAAILLIIARRQGGAAHMLRVIVALAAFALAVSMLDASLQGQWLAILDITGRPNVAASIEAHLDQSKPFAAVMALLTFAGGMVLLVWPSAAGRRRETALAHSEETAR